MSARFKIRFFSEYISDMALLKEYLEQNYIGTSRKLFTLLKKQLSHLKQYPYSCPVYEDDTDYRKIVVGNYLVFYMINENDKTIDVHRIFHGSKDIQSQINRDHHAVHPAD